MDNNSPDARRRNKITHLNKDGRQISTSSDCIKTEFTSAAVLYWHCYLESFSRFFMTRRLQNPSGC